MNNRIVYTVRHKPQAGWLRRAAYIGIFPAVLVLLAGGVAAFLGLPYFKIHEINVSGAQLSEERAVKQQISSSLDGAYLSLLPRRSYFLADIESIVATLRKELPHMDEIQVKKRFPATIDVVLTPRTFWGIYCNSSESGLVPECVYIDPTGFAYQEASQARGGLILVVESDGGPARVGNMAIEPAIMERLRLLENKLAEAVGVSVAGFELRSRAPSEIRVKTSDGFMLVFSRDDDIDETLRVLKRVLDQEIKEKRERLDYIDLRFGNKVFYKFK